MSTLIPTPPNSSSVRDNLDQVLESPSFRNAARLSRFLRFIVEQTLADAQEELKESVVGVQVFDRPPDYDPKADSIVRVQARQLRSKLQEYYAGSGSGDAIRFEIPKGSYAPVIRSVGIDEPPVLVLDAKPWEPTADLAVLPFVNMSSDPENEYFSDGITEEILSALAQVRGLRLIARTSSFQFKGRNRDVREIARQLGARAVLEGSVRRAGNQLRVTAQLIEGADGTHLWTGIFDARLTEPAQVFAIQESIAWEISLRTGKVAVGSPADSTEEAGRPVSVAAYDHYLRARKLMRELRAESIMAAIPLLEAAIAIDPGYAAAYATLAGCYGHLGIYGGPAGAGALPKARQLALEAVRRDPHLADGHTLLGNIAAALDLNLSAAREHYARALELDPQNSYARQSRALWLLGPSGETAEALAEVERLLQLDPLSLDLRHTYLITLYFAQRYEDVVRQATLVLELMPQSFAAYFYRSVAYEGLGDDERALADLKAHAALLPNMLIEDHVASLELERAGRHAEAVAAAHRMEQDPRAGFAATVLADLWMRLGDSERALDWLEKAYELRIFRVLWTGVDRTYDPLRGMPRFEALRQKLALG